MLDSRKYLVDTERGSGLVVLLNPPAAMRLLQAIYSIN